MQIRIVSPARVHYNPATNMFEALVTLDTTKGRFRYPCAVEGSIKMPPCGAAFKLTQQAKSRHLEHDDICAVTTPPLAGHWAHQHDDHSSARKAA